MGFILVEQTQTSVEHTEFTLLYFVDHNQTMLVEHNHTMPVEHTNVTRSDNPVSLGSRIFCYKSGCTNRLVFTLHSVINSGYCSQMKHFLEVEMQRNY